MEKNKGILVKVLRMQCREMINYTYLLMDETSAEAYIIDPSWEMEKITAGLYGYQIKGILLTHYHYDHVNLVTELVKIYNCNCYIGLDEINYYNFFCLNMMPVFDMGELLLGNSPILCLQTPGHSRGSMCYLTENKLFTGDTLFMEGCGACDMKGGSAEDMFDSLAKIKRFVSSDTLIYPGHAFSMDVGAPYEKVYENNIYMQLLDREKFIQFRMRKNKTQVKFK